MAEFIRCHRTCTTHTTSVPDVLHARLKQNATLFDYMIHMAALSARHTPPTCPGPPVGPGCGLTDTERHERHIYVHTLYMP